MLGTIKETISIYPDVFSHAGRHRGKGLKDGKQGKTSGAAWGCRIPKMGQRANGLRDRRRFNVEGA